MGVQVPLRSLKEFFEEIRLVILKPNQPKDEVSLDEIDTNKHLWWDAMC
jgi:hypothetical protein